MEIKVGYLTDRDIDLYTDEVITEYRDVALNVSANRDFDPYENGIYDPRIFGSMYSDRCNCGALHNTSKHDYVGVPCYNCRSEILSDTEAYKRFGKIKLPIYYCNEYHYPNFIKFIQENFSLEFEFEKEDDFFIKSERYTRKNMPKILETCQFNYDEESGVLIATDKIDDLTRVSFEGLIKITSDHFKELLPELMTYLNKLILVTPIITRAPSFRIVDGEKEFKNDTVSAVFRNILYVINVYYPKVIDTEVSTPKEVAYFHACIRRYLTKATANISRLTFTSKENIVRLIQQNRLYNSGRATIVPAPDLNPDEVYIPTHLMYECCKDEFIEYIQDYYNCSKRQAQYKYRHYNDDPEIQELFRDYIDGKDDPDGPKYVIINRAPTLHELNLMMMRVKLTNDYCMKIPMAICTPFNADYDGDQMAFYSIPKKRNADMTRYMSPRNLFYFKKSHEPLFMPTQEILQGLIFASKVRVPQEMLEFDSLEDVLEYKKTDRKFTNKTAFKLQGVETTIYREQLTELFGLSINDYLNGLGNCLNSGNIVKLYLNLNHFDDRMERIHKIQELALKVVTMSGSSNVSISELYMEIPNKYLDEMKRIESSDMSQGLKALKIQSLYEEYTKEVMESIPKDVIQVFSDSARAKINSFRDMVTTRVTFTPDKRIKVGSSSLFHGMTNHDYINLAIENRAVQSVKGLNVPLGGYLTRQYSLISNSVIYTHEEDPNNAGILIRKCDAEGRTALDGTILGDSDSKEMVLVRSIVASDNMKLERADYLPKAIYKYDEGAIVGLSMINSLTEQLTQGGLALKHGGNLFTVEPNGTMIATGNCRVVSCQNRRMVLQANGRTFEYPVPNDFILNDLTEFKQGDIIGRLNKLNTPTYLLSSIIKLCGAIDLAGKRAFMKNEIQISDSIATNEGVIHYAYDEEDNVSVFIDGVEYEYNDNALYLYPEGTFIEKFQRICTGTVGLECSVNRGLSKTEVYYVFRTQMKELLRISDELLELLFCLMTVKSADEEDDSYSLGSISSNSRNSDSLYNSLLSGYATNRLKKIPAEGEQFVMDPIVRTVLPLLVTGDI